MLCTVASLVNTLDASETTSGNKGWTETMSKIHLVCNSPLLLSRKKAQTADIDACCEQTGLDKDLRNNRNKAREHLAKTQYAQWAANQRQILDTVIPDTYETGFPEGDNTRTALDDTPDNFSTNDTTFTSFDEREDIRAECSDMTQIDQRLRGLVGDLSGVRVDARANEDTQCRNDDLADAYLTLLQAEQQHGEKTNMLTGPANEFISFLLKINLVAVATEMLPRDLEKGNSQDAPGRFWFHCKKDGCERKFVSSLRREQHYTTCQGLSASIDLDEAPGAASEALPFIPRTGMERIRKRQDISKASEDFPKQCPDRDVCKVTKESATDHLMKNHRRLHHDENWPEQTSCNVPGCQLPKSLLCVQGSL